ncbi:MAG: hypothetical protein JWO38_5627 [Gemmataceae bacterium]|nr:hypothetical protein [Gemmataceae bacterium]
MRFLPRLSAALVLAACGVLGSAGSASAAWNNVFQVCCNDCNRPQTSYYAPPPAACPQPCPQPEVRVSYVQRCYYQPVTEYVRKSFYEPVTRNYTSYYYEPVTEYRYTTYYDPCTGCPQRVCTPTTSYRMRAKCNSVTSYVERCAMVPVTSLRPVTVRQPVVTYYYPPEPVCPPVGGPVASPIIPPATPSVEQIREQPPGVMPPGSASDMIPAQTLPATPGTSFPRANPNGTPKIRPDKTTSRSTVVTVRGEVVMPDQMSPRGGAKLVFVNAANKDQREYVSANQYGEFDIRLPAGNWYVYLGGADGRAVYHKQVSLGDRDTYDYKVVSR